ncbi:MAG: MBL fold metallo-hydrolase [Clostridia bacterium]|nr:MBL fold metallo-hydrolase [Clostridia bacterium]
MEVTFLGTAAATACPMVFCSCPMCSAAWKRGEKDLRRRSSALVDGDLIIDLGPDIMTAAFDFGADVRKIRVWLQTHAHSDHFDAGHLITRWTDYAPEGLRPLDLAASPETVRRMSERLSLEEPGASLEKAEWLERLKLRVHPLRHGDSAVLSGRLVTAVESAHDPGALLYVVSDSETAFLYATDTVRLTDRAMDLLKRFRLDLVAIDHTYGPGIRGGGHLNAEQAAEEIARLRSEGILKPEGLAFATHISHEGMPPHEELTEYARARGYGIAWDGLRIRLPLR